MDSTTLKNAKHTNIAKKRKPSANATTPEFEPNFEYDDKNRCLICKVDMGDCNPRQYCCKTHCENGPVDSGE